MEELSVTINEELDLLSKWHGPESSKYALSIRSANTNDPSRALMRIWERMDERYSSPELFESVLKLNYQPFRNLLTRTT